MFIYLKILTSIPSSLFLGDCRDTDAHVFMKTTTFLNTSVLVSFGILTVPSESIIYTDKSCCCSSFSNCIVQPSVSEFTGHYYLSFQLVLIYSPVLLRFFLLSPMITACFMLIGVLIHFYISVSCYLTVYRCFKIITYHVVTIGIYEIPFSHLPIS